MRYADSEILKKLIDNLEWQEREYKNETLELYGKISNVQTTLANIRQWQKEN